MVEEFLGLCKRSSRDLISFCPAEIIDEEREREQIKIPEEKRPGKGREREKEGGERETGDEREMGEFHQRDDD